MSRESSGIRVAVTVGGNLYVLGRTQVAVLVAVALADRPVPATAIMPALGYYRARQVYSALDSLAARGLVRMATAAPWEGRSAHHHHGCPSIDLGHVATRAGRDVAAAIRRKDVTE